MLFLRSVSATVEPEFPVTASRWSADRVTLVTARSVAQEVAVDC